jgi:hypothetical protein
MSSEGVLGLTHKYLNTIDSLEQGPFWGSDNYPVQIHFGLYEGHSIFIVSITVGYWALSCARRTQAAS